MPAADQPAMPSPARAADRSIALAVRLGVSRRQAPALIAEICGATAGRLAQQGVTDLEWIWQVQRRAVELSGQPQHQTSLPTDRQGE